MRSCATKLFSAHPLTKVRLTDKEPGEFQASWRWARRPSRSSIGAPHILPYELWEAVNQTRRHTNLKAVGPVWLYYANEEVAREALSDGAVALGRELSRAAEKG